MSNASVQSTKQEVKKAAKKVEYSPLVETLTRIGFGVRGLIYFVIGFLALKVALGMGGGKLATPQDAINTIGSSPFGDLLLWVILVGLVSYGLWGLIRAFLDPLHKGHDLKGLVQRFGFLVSAFGYFVLIPPTYAYLTGHGKTSDGSQTPSSFFPIMSMPLGRWVIGIVGLSVLFGGLYQVYLGLKAHFDRQFEIYQLTRDQAKTAINVARFGTAARGAVFAITGFLLMLAAYQANPGKQIGFDAAMATLLQLSYGRFLLAFIALGLMAFGVYSGLSALWFRLKR